MAIHPQTLLRTTFRSWQTHKPKQVGGRLVWMVPVASVPEVRILELVGIPQQGVIYKVHLTTGKILAGLCFSPMAALPEAIFTLLKHLGQELTLAEKFQACFGSNPEPWVIDDGDRRVFNITAFLDLFLLGLPIDPKVEPEAIIELNFGRQVAQALVVMAKGVPSNVV